MADRGDLNSWVTLGHEIFFHLVHFAQPFSHFVEIRGQPFELVASSQGETVGQIARGNAPRSFGDASNGPDHPARQQPRRHPPNTQSRQGYPRDSSNHGL
jgi:hypothetical protein